MTDHKSVRKIGVFGHVGTQNLGDEIIIAATLQNIRRRYPDAEIVGFTFNPEDTRVRHGIRTFPIRRVGGRLWDREDVSRANSGTNATREPEGLGERIKTKLKRVRSLYPILNRIRKGFEVLRGSLEELGFLSSCYKNLKGTDLLIIAGSGQLTDHSGGPWAYPYTFFKWSVLAWLLGTKLVFLSVGTSWIRSPLSQFFLRSSLSRAHYRSYRDESSGNEVKKLGVSGTRLIVPDLAYSLEMPRVKAAEKPGSRPVVGINPIPFFHERFWHESDTDIYDRYVQMHASFACWLIQRDYSVLFFPTQLRADPPAISDIKRAMGRMGIKSSSQVLSDLPIRSSEDLISAISMTDAVVAARYHGVLVSLLLHKPVLAISYHSKTTDLMAQIGQSERTLDIAACTLDMLKDRFVLLETKRKGIEADLELRVPAFRTALNVQYERVFNLLEQNPA